MNKFEIVGGELVDAMVPESLVKFNYTLFAMDLEDAKAKFFQIFPGCSLESLVMSR